MEYPGNFARFYDLMYHQLRGSVDHQFFSKEINSTKGKVLEIGVGTGRLFIEAVNQGADIFGIDISPAMVDILLSKLNDKYHSRISLQNIIDFKNNFKFDLVIAPFRVIMHVFEIDEQIRAINNVFDHLEQGGRFIFDAFVPDFKQLLSGIDNKTDFEGEYESGKKIKRTVSTKPDLINQTIDVEFTLEWDEGNEVKQESWNLPIRYFFRYELEHLIARSKFEKYKILGDFQGNELNDQSKEFVVECKK